MTISFYDLQKYKTITVTGVTAMAAGLVPGRSGGRRAKAWICVDKLGRRVGFRQDRFEIRKIGG